MKYTVVDKSQLTLYICMKCNTQFGIVEAQFGIHGTHPQDVVAPRCPYCGRKGWVVEATGEFGER